MAIKAVAFDIGGVLERVEPPEQFLAPWVWRLGRSVPDALGTHVLHWPLTRLDPDDAAKTGAITEIQYRRLCEAALHLASSQADEFMADFWDWYCGELDDELVSYAAGLRPRYRTGILSNSLAGARREEQARYGFEQLTDVVIYSAEVGLAKPDPRVYQVLCSELGVEPDDLVFVDNRLPNVEAACNLGIHGILHVSTPESIKAVNTLLGRAAA